MLRLLALLVLLVAMVSLAAPAAPAAPPEIAPLPHAAGERLPQGAVMRLGSQGFQIGGKAKGIAVFPDGKSVAVATDDEISVWDLASGRRLSSMLYPPRQKREFSVTLGVGPYQNPLVVTADGKALLFLFLGRVYRYPLPLGVAPEVLGAPPGVGINAFVPGAQADTVLGLNTKGELVEWRPKTKEWVVSKMPPVAKLRSFAAGGGAVAVRAREGPVLLWDVGAEKSLGEIKIDGDPAIAISADGKWLITSDSGANGVQVWDVRTQKEATAGKRHLGGVLICSPDGLLAAGSPPAPRRGIRIVDVKNGTELFILNIASLGVLFRPSPQSLQFLPDGSGLVGVGEQGAISRWDMRTGELQPLGSPGHTKEVRAVVPLAEGKWMTCGNDGTARLWAADGTAVREFTGAHTATAVSPDGKTLFACDRGDRAVVAWDVAKGTELRRYTEQRRTDRIRALAISGDGKMLAVGGEQAGVTLLDAATFEVTANLKPQRPLAKDTVGNDVTAVAFAGGNRLVSRYRNDCYVWDLEKKTEVCHIANPRKDAPRIGMAVSPDGKHFVAANLAVVPEIPNSLDVFESESGRWLKAIYPAKNAMITAVAYSPDGTLVVVGDAAGKVHVVDLEKKAVRHTFDGHRGPVYCVAFSLDGKTIASGGADTTVLVWNVPKP